MSTPITLTGAYTCTHHNDKQRAACPVCLVAAITAERDQLRAEVERLRSDRDCEKRLRKDADEFRENAIARAERAEADAAAYFQRANSFSKIGDEAEADLATERARLDWLLLDVVSRFDDAYYTRATIDAVMKEDAK